ncbi:protein of unknown function [Candidatus Methylocalor cossyra]|uniref:Uncharacterized protein n=1 Tax=Candidatus Methylocalor cossyra TaxID=3108543 RepID=A0ABM9NIU8_9GAMM
MCQMMSRGISSKHIDPIITSELPQSRGYERNGPNNDMGYDLCDGNLTMKCTVRGP